MVSLFVFSLVLPSGPFYSVGQRFSGVLRGREEIHPMKHSVQKSGTAPGRRLTPWSNIAIVCLVVSALVPSRAAAGTNVVLRLDASQFRSAGILTVWSDVSGNVHDATAGGDPEVVLNGLNSLPVVSLDGNDYFIAAHSYTTGTAFAVAKFDNTVWNGHDGLYGAATGNGAIEQYWTGSGSGSGTNWANESGGGFVNSKYLNGYLTHQALTDPAAFNLYSGVDTTPTNFASWAIGTDRGFGGSRAWEGDIAEVIVYDDALSDFDRKGVEVYLDEKWGLGQNLRTTYGAGNFNDDPASLDLLTTESKTMVLRLDASRFRSASGALAAWPDRSGNGHDATGISDPAVVLAELNGLPVVSLDGNDYFTISDTYTAGTVFAVAKYNTLDGKFVGHDGLYGGTGGNATNIYFSGSANSSNWNAEAEGQMVGAKYDNGVLNNSVATLNQWNLFSGVDTTPQSLLKHNVGADRSDTFGGSRAWDGAIAEIIVYEEPLSSFDRMGVEVYLDEKWGLGLDLRTTYGEASFNTDIIALGLVPPQGMLMCVQ